jgi:hypothetical protein
VTLIVADGLGEEIRNGVRFHDVGPKTGGRFARMTGTTSRVYQAALALRPDIVHFHDPELIPAAVRLKQAGIKVIYDVHEDMPRQILAKHWIPVPSVRWCPAALKRWKTGRPSALTRW